MIICRKHSSIVLFKYPDECTTALLWAQRIWSLQYKHRHSTYLQGYTYSSVTMMYGGIIEDSKTVCLEINQRHWLKSSVLGFNQTPDFLFRVLFLLYAQDHI